ncbi:hypothetical protein A6A19_00225 [Actinobacillus delphinicola]|nr:hypothetical protein [Actinobacillus delphinicola]
MIRIKAVTWNNYMRHLRAIVNFGIKFELIKTTKNPFKDAFVKEDKPPRKSFSCDQLKKIDICLSNDLQLPEILKPQWFMQAVIYTLKYTGMRRSTLLKLQLKDLNLEENTIAISPHNNKNHNYQEIPILSILKPYLQKLMEMHIEKNSVPTQQFFNINLFSRATYYKTTKMTNDQLSYLFMHLSKLVQFKVSPHRFRHTLATMLMQDPKNIYITQNLLGHSDIKVTMTYISYNPSMLKEPLEKLFN